MRLAHARITAPAPAWHVVGAPHMVLREEAGGGRRTGTDSMGSAGGPRHRRLLRAPQAPSPSFPIPPPHPLTPAPLSSAAGGDSHLHTFGKDFGFFSEGGVTPISFRSRPAAGPAGRTQGRAGWGLAGGGALPGAGPSGSPGGARAQGVRGGGRALGAASCPARGLSPSSARWRLCNCHTLSCRRWAGVTAAAFSGPRAAICSADSSCSGERGQHPQGCPSAGSPNLGQPP